MITLLLSLLLGVGMPPGGAAVGPVSFSDGSPGAAYREVLFFPDPQGRVVAASFRFPVGSAQDPIGGEGTAFLLGRVMEAAGTERLLRHGARIQVEVRSDEFLVTMLAAPGRWREALGEVEALVFTWTPASDELDRAREGILDVLRFEEGAPVRSFEWERAALVLGITHPAARPLQGTSGSVGSVGVSELLAYRTGHLSRANGVVAASGPIQAADLEGALGSAVRTLRFREAEPAPAPTPAPPAPQPAGGEPPAPSDPPPSPPLPPAPRVRSLGTDAAPLRVPTGAGASRSWETGDRIIQDRQLTATWIALAYPFPAGTPPLLLEFLGHLVMEDLNPTPPDPGLYETSVSVMRVGAAPVLVISASVDPRVTSTWETRLLAAMVTLAESPPTGSFFELSRRRFRSALLLELAVPEARTRWLARQAALEGGEVADPELEVWRLDRDAVSEAARAAGSPRILLMGPESMMGR